jgi:peroxiredoxin Q/BCP
MYNIAHKIQVGEMAPDFHVKRSDGREVRLYDCKNKKTVLLFFFNQAKSGCLDRLKALAADYGKFRDAGAVIFPVSIMKADEGRALAQKLGLPFGILCDDDHHVVRLYNMGQCSETPVQVCFEVIHDVERPTMLVVDTSGVIRYREAAGARGPDSSKLLDECRKALK